MRPGCRIEARIGQRHITGNGSDRNVATLACATSSYCGRVSMTLACATPAFHVRASAALGHANPGSDGSAPTALAHAISGYHGSAPTALACYAGPTSAPSSGKLPYASTRCNAVQASPTLSPRQTAAPTTTTTPKPASDGGNSSSFSQP